MLYLNARKIPVRLLFVQDGDLRVISQPTGRPQQATTNEDTSKTPSRRGQTIDLAVLKVSLWWAIFQSSIFGEKSMEKSSRHFSSSRDGRFHTLTIVTVVSEDLEERKRLDLCVALLRKREASPTDALEQFPDNQLELART